ncbi:unnamed protein product, partial [Laminaria digitata]
MKRRRSCYHLNTSPTHQPRPHLPRNMGFRSIFGGGKIAVPGKNVKVCYEGCFPDGRVFDKNQNRRRPLQFRIGMRSVIVGMDRGVEGMRVGGSREISIPAALAYGARGTGPIAANQNLVFRLEIV